MIVALHALQRTEKERSGARPSATRYRVWQFSQKMSMCGHDRCNNRVGVGTGRRTGFSEKSNVITAPTWIACDPVAG
jgi:hypothetical protein